jgi:hypothetical protein
MIKYIIGILLCLMPVPFITNAQIAGSNATKASSPVNWQFSIKKMDNGNYRLEAKAVMSEGFHIWAQDPGGDGTLIPTSFTAEQIPNGKWIGDWKEQETPKVQKLEYVDGAVRFHEKSVTFFREFKATSGDKIKGAVQYQSCNDRMCLPPAIQNFAVVAP